MNKNSKIFSVCSHIFGTEGFVCALTAVMIAQYLIIFPPALCSVLNLILYAWGAPLMAVHLVRQKSFSKKSNKLWLLFYLIVSFFAVSVVSILIHVPQNIVSNLSAWYSCGLQVFFCCYVIACAKKEQARRLFSLIVFTTVLVTLAVAAACLVMQFLNIYPLKATTSRFTGLFYNPNNCFICAMSILLSFLYWMLFHKFRALMIVNMLLQASLIGLSGSRSLLVMMGVFIALMPCIYAARRYSKNLKKAIGCAALLMVSAVLVFQAMSYAGQALPQIGHTIETTVSSWFSSEEGGSSSSNGSTQSPPDTNRTEENTDASDSFRMLLLQSGLKTFAKYPLFGVGPRNIADAVRATAPDANLNGIDGGGVHNSYLQLLISIGIVGFLIFVLILVYCFTAFTKAMRAQQEKEGTICFELLFLLAAILCIGVYGTFESTLFFANTPAAVTFFAVTGFFLHTCFCRTSPAVFARRLHEKKEAR